MASLWLSTNRWLTWFHRWAGVVLCLFFAMWFATGAVLHFVGFPSLSPGDQAASSEVIALPEVRIGAADALKEMASATDLRLISVAGEPTYVVTAPGGRLSAISATSGDRVADLSMATARVVAERFSRRAVSELKGPFTVDQWVVHQRFDPYRPFFKARLDDRDATELYVSARTGEVVQRTTATERRWNWAGAVLHWIYFTALRQNWSAWNQTVWWLSLVALVASSVGVWLGVLRTVSNRAAGRRGWSPFRGWMRWHHLIGLFASVVVISWMLSGWLSMDHGRLFSHADPTVDQVANLRGMSLPAIGSATTHDALNTLGQSSQITFNAIAGQPFLTAYGVAGKAPRVLLLGSSGKELLASLPENLIGAGVHRVWPTAESAAGDSYDALYRLAESAGRQATAFVDASGGGTRLYVDRLNGRLLAVMDPSRRSYAWIYYALHTFNFPGLLNHEALRTTVVLLLLGFGLVFSTTGAVLGFQRLRRQFP